MPENVWDPYREEQLSPAGEIVLPYCLFVLRSQGQIILADTGMGAGPHLSRGNLSGNLLNELQNIIDSMWTIYGRGLGLDPSPEREYHDMGSQSDSDQGRAFGHDSIDNQKWMDFDYLHENDLLIVGSPETVARKLKSAAGKGLFNVFCGAIQRGVVARRQLDALHQTIWDQGDPGTEGVRPSRRHAPPPNIGVTKDVSQPYVQRAGVLEGAYPGGPGFLARKS